MKKLLSILFLLSAFSASSAVFTNINVGSAANDGTGDTIRTMALKINAGFLSVSNNFATNSAEGKLNRVSDNATNITFTGTNLVTSRGSTTARSMESRFAEEWNILDFGATDGGVIDTALATIISGIPNGTAIRVPVGTYYIQSVTNASKHLVFRFDDGATFIHGTNASGNMLHSTGGSITMTGRGILDGNKANQASTATNWFSLLYSDEPMVNGLTFTNWHRYAAHSEHTSIRVILKDVKAINGHALLTNTTFANAAFAFASDVENARPELILDDVYIEGEDTVNRLPGGTIIAGSDLVNAFWRVSVKNYRGNRVGDDHVIGAAHYGIAFFDSYEDIESLHGEGFNLTNGRYMGLKIQNAGNVSISKATLHTTGTVGLGYTPGERSQTNAYPNASFRDIAVYGDPDRTYGFFIAAGDSGGFYNVDIDGFYGRSLFRVGEVEGFDVAGVAKGYGPVRVRNIDGVAGSGIVVKGLLGDAEFSSGYIYATNGSAFVATQTNSTATIRLRDLRIKSDTGGNVTVRGVKNLMASGLEIEAVSGIAVNLEADADGNNILGLYWDDSNKIISGSTSMTDADIDKGWYASAGVTKFYPELVNVGPANGYRFTIGRDSASAESMFLVRNVTSAGAALMGFASESSLGSINIFDDTYSDSDRAGRFDVRAESTAAGLDLSSVSGTIRFKPLNATSGIMTGTNFAWHGGITAHSGAFTNALTLGGTSVSVVGHTHAIADTTGLQSALDLKAPLASPALTGNPTAPTPAENDNDTSIATTAYVQLEIASLGTAANWVAEGTTNSLLHGIAKLHSLTATNGANFGDGSTHATIAYALGGRITNAANNVSLTNSLPILMSSNLTVNYTLTASNGVGTAGQVLSSGGAGLPPIWLDSAAGGVSDGDKGDITVSASGATWTIDANSVDLSTDTTGNYAAGDAEAGAALTGDTATAFFSSGTIESARLPTTVTEHRHTITFDGGGEELVDGTNIDFPVKHAWTITGYEIIGDQTGSVEFHLAIEEDPYDGSNIYDNPASGGADVDASAPPSLSSQLGKFSTTLTGWDTSWPAGSMINVSIVSATTTERATLIIYYTK